MAEISEKELEDYLFSLKINRNPLLVDGKCFRQVNLGGYGIIDLLYIDIKSECAPPEYPQYPYVTITVVELKKGSIDFSSLGQICRYKRGLERFLSQQINKRYHITSRIKVEGVLVGSDYANGDICYTIDQINWLECWHYNLDLKEGIELEHSTGWYRDDEDFKSLFRLKEAFFPRYLRLFKNSVRSDRKRICDTKK